MFSPVFNALDSSSKNGAFPPHIICQLCSKPYRDPRILPCLHSFCAQCLHKEIERSGTKQNMECPTCQRSITIPEGGVNFIPQNLHLGFEVEVAGYMSKIGSDGEKSCDVCIDGGKGPAVVFCCTCGQFLCTFCHENHKASKMFYCHQIVGLEKESLNTELLPSIMTPTSEHFCSQPHHQKEELKFYCETCQCLACRDCTLVLHKDHRIAEVCDIAKVHRDGMREALMFAQDVTSKLTSAIDASGKMAEQVETSRENATLLINQAFEQLHQTIEKRKTGLLSVIEALSISKTTTLNLQKKQILKMQDEIGRFTEMTSHILQTHTDHEVVALGGLLPTELKATVKKVGRVSLIDDTGMDVSLPTDSLIRSLAAFGNITDIHVSSSLFPPPSPSQSTWSSGSAAKVREVYCVKVETKTSKGERYPDGGLQVKAELRPKSHDGAFVQGEVKDHGDGTYTITLTPQTAGCHQLVITMDGQHIQNSPHDLDAKLIVCKLEQTFGEFPSGIAIDGCGDIYIGNARDGHIHVFDQVCREKRTIHIGKKGDRYWSGLFGISIKGDVIYVADSDNNRILKLTTEGKFLQKFEKFGHKGLLGHEHFRGPVSVIVDHRDRMIVADHCNNRVVILDQNGNWLSSITIDLPYGVALDSQGNIHVVAGLNNCSSEFSCNAIQVFTPEGAYVRSYGKVHSQSGITIFEGYSFVCGYSGSGRESYVPFYNDNHYFAILDPQGKEVLKVDKLTSSVRLVILSPKGDSLYAIDSFQICKYSVQW